MNIIAVDYTVKRIDWTTYSSDCPRGSGYCSDQGTTQYLIKEFRIFGVKIWGRTIDKEHIPMFAIIDNAVLGYTSWKSKFKQYIK